jgi:hypothetical protein
MGLQELRTEFNEIVTGMSSTYDDLTKHWKLCQFMIIVLKGDDEAKSAVSFHRLQKKLIKTQMLLINALRTKDVRKFKILLDEYREGSLECMNYIEEDGCNSVSVHTGSKNEQSYIELCDDLKKSIDEYSELLKALVKMVYIENHCSE